MSSVFLRPALLLARGLGGALGRRVMGPLVCGRCRAATLEPAPAHAAGSDGRPLLGAGFAYRAPTLASCPPLLRVPVEQRPLRSVAGIGDLDAGLLEAIADRVGLRPVTPALASSRRCTSACTRTSTAASAADVSSFDSQRSSSGSAPRMPIMARIDIACASAASWSPASSARLPSARALCTSASAIGTARSSSSAAANFGVHSPGTTAPTRLRTRCRKSSTPV